MSSYVIGLDIGTSAVKAVLFARSGYVIAEQEMTYPTMRPQIGWAEQDPLAIERATKQVLRQLIEIANVPSDQIVAIGLSSAMHSIICVDERGEPLSPLITWADQRSYEQAERIKRNPSSTIYMKTGTPLHPMTPLMKLIWMKETDYEPYKRADKFVSFKEFLLFRWTGATVVDYATASASGLFNITSLCWEEEALKEAGITKEQLFSPVPPTYICQGLPKKLANEIGIRHDIPFVVGASDGPLANIGLGAMTPGDVAITIGTSGAIRQMSALPRLDERQDIFCYAVSEKLWVMGGPTNNGGSVLHWLKDLFHSRNVDYEQLSELASRSPIGAKGLLFLPYLDGERAPLWNAHARAAYVGLTSSHTEADLIRAGMEGTLFNMYQIGQSLERLGSRPKNVFASGGFSRSSLWVQMLADIFGREIQLPLNYQSSAWAAAWFALIATGIEKNIEDIKQSIPMKGTVKPNERAHETYRKLFSIYEETSEKLRDVWDELATFNA